MSGAESKGGSKRKTDMSTDSDDDTVVELAIVTKSGRNFLRCQPNESQVNLGRDDKDEYSRHVRTHKRKDNQAKVPFTRPELKKFNAEITALVAEQNIIDTKFQAYTPDLVLYKDSEGAVGYRKPETNDDIYHLYHASYTEQTKTDEPAGHFIVSNTLSPFNWYLQQLNRSRDERNPVPDPGPHDNKDKNMKGKTKPHCEHTTKATLAGQKTDWKSVRLVMSGVTLKLMLNIKYFCNSTAKVSDLHGSTGGKHDFKFWLKEAQQKTVDCLKTHEIPLR